MESVSGAEFVLDGFEKPWKIFQETSALKCHLVSFTFPLNCQDLVLIILIY